MEGLQAPTGTPGSSSRPPLSWRARISFVLVLLLVLAVLAATPIVIRSLRYSMAAIAHTPVYDLVTGRMREHAQVMAGENLMYLNLSISDIEESTRTATIIVAGNRDCSATCRPLHLTVFSMDLDGSLLPGLPPSAVIHVPDGENAISQTVTLPVSGNPQRYPFDAYTLIIGLSAMETMPDGKIIVPSREEVLGSNALTVNSTLTRLSMHPPVPVPMVEHAPASQVHKFFAMQRIVFHRPAYIKIICTLLVVLISASGFFALGTQTLRQLSIGIGGLILGIWGVRSIVIQGDLPDLTLVDTILAIIILLLLLGLAVRVALAIHRGESWTIAEAQER